MCCAPRLVTVIISVSLKEILCMIGTCVPCSKTDISTIQNLIVLAPQNLIYGPSHIPCLLDIHTLV